MQLLGQTEGQLHPLVDVQPLEKSFHIRQAPDSNFLLSNLTLVKKAIMLKLKKKFPREGASTCLVYCRAVFCRNAEFEQNFHYIYYLKH